MRTKVEAPDFKSPKPEFGLIDIFSKGYLKWQCKLDYIFKKTTKKQVLKFIIHDTAVI